MNRLKKKLTAAVIGLSMVASMGAGAYAASNLTPIKAFLNWGLSFKVNGKPFQLRDGNGGTLSPITYNNTTYLPIRSVSDALGIAVHVDNKGLIQLGETVDGISIATGFEGDNRTKDPSKTVYDGKDYKDVFLDNNSGDRSASFMLYPKKKYQKLYIQVAAIGKDIKAFNVQDSDTDIELKTKPIAMGDGLVTIEVDIGGSDALYVWAETSDGGSVFIPMTTSYFK
ncbi:hypothetical protein OMP40_07880 [Cohnella rhizosphaerae]|uniref:Copper amine oxidase-like N-terminal domain-containing protein n=1 Tax=Cohnella rhizosphaerae TaxID=1457232 RepID=A0A9X4QSG6_9BACL|nr:hypothetical protein [Cohnella rhizosphaerae]